MEMNLVSNGENAKQSDDLGVAYVDLSWELNAEKRLARCKHCSSLFYARFGGRRNILHLEYQKIMLTANFD
ncbi:unnamed protein product [Gongylonema pulchrum]|uniref:Zf-C2H2_3 domain-containing protein n=1 Tax=Gongylonema pulchrum TaxID=637853 RepID=A0A183F1L6_9BILA|nr:unnamed protein product [Gongylonema pulchrum]VDN49975.1 unnamed protein product [Gongylonema pulchrum]